jgi:DNA-binding beta-propeller fold protein YncE
MHTRTRDDSTRARLGVATAIAGAAIAGLLALPAASRAAPGALTQAPGLEGCISDDGDECTDGDLLFGAFGLGLSRDGRHAYVALADGRGVAVFARDRSTGALTQLPSPQGCTTRTGDGGLCATGRGIDVPLSLAVTPDGRHVYVASSQRDPVSISSLALFSRNAATGALTQLPGDQGCISEDIGGGVCTPGVALRVTEAVAVSPDGRHVYTASRADAVAVFARNAETGFLTQLPEPQGCVSQSGHGGRCVRGRALDGASGVAVSKDGRFVYAASELSRAVAVFSRNRKTGALTQLPGEAGCIAENSNDEGCTDGVGMGGPHALAVSPSGRNVYVVNPVSDQLTVLTRNRQTGTLGQIQCLEDDGSIVCEPAVALRQPQSVTVSPDGRRVYVGARDSDAIAVFAYDGELGTLTQLASPEACISEDGTQGLCTQGRALNGPRSVVASRDGRHVYVASQGSAAVAVLKRSR